MENKITPPTTKGLIIALILIAISVVTQVLITDMTEMQKYSWISYVIMIGSIVWACMSYAKDMNGNVTFGNLFAHGFKTTAVATVLLLIYTILSVTILFPEMKDKIVEAAREQMVKEGKMNGDQIDQAIELTRKFFIPFAIGGVLIGNIILGAIGALIGAAIAKKNPNPVFPDQVGS